MVRCIRQGEKAETACTFSDLKEGDTFWSNGKPHLVGYKASYYVGKGYVVYDEALNEFGLEDVEKALEGSV